MRQVYPTMITPYLKDQRIDGDAVDALVAFYIAQGCEGVFAVCQSSEMFHLSLRERVWLARRVVKAAAGRLHVVASGHISSALEDQQAELRAMAETGIDALVLVTNRMAAADEDDEIWIQRAERLLDALPRELPLGLYECPAPYKRLLSEKLLRWCADSGRFSFIKDTCCDAALIRSRLQLIKGSGIALYNANSLTLLDSLRAGAAGFSGVMANMHPDLYLWLCKNHRQSPGLAEQLQAMLSYMSLLEAHYPMCAKDHLNSMGVRMGTFSRVQAADSYGPTARELTRQLALMENAARRLIAADLQATASGRQATTHDQALL